MILVVKDNTSLRELNVPKSVIRLIDIYNKKD